MKDTDKILETFYNSQNLNNFSLDYLNYYHKYFEISYNPENEIIDKIYYKQLVGNKIKKLSETEQKILHAYYNAHKINRNNYSQIQNVFKELFPIVFLFYKNLNYLEKLCYNYQQNNLNDIQIKIISDLKFKYYLKITSAKHNFENLEN